ncbi:hypothetical protein I7093_005533 [Vibrio parahaemolyticus]|nr:hypothetical protein [Vibrio parahaemolyticus]
MCILAQNQGYVTLSFEFAHNKQFKRDSQRLAFLFLLQFLWLRYNALGWVVALLTP